MAKKRTVKQRTGKKKAGATRKSGKNKPNAPKRPSKAKAQKFSKADKRAMKTMQRGLTQGSRKGSRLSAGSGAW